MKAAGSPRAVVKQRHSLFISSPVRCVQINFKGGRDVGRRRRPERSGTCVWSPSQQAPGHRLAALSPSLDSRWVSCCKLNTKQGPAQVCTERVSWSSASRELVGALPCIQADFVGQEGRARTVPASLRCARRCCGKIRTFPGVRAVHCALALLLGGRRARGLLFPGPRRPNRC